MKDSDVVKKYVTDYLSKGNYNEVLNLLRRRIDREYDADFKILLMSAILSYVKNNLISVSESNLEKMKKIYDLLVESEDVNFQMPSYNQTKNIIKEYIYQMEMKIQNKLTNQR